MSNQAHARVVAFHLRQHGVALSAFEEARAHIVLLQEIDEGAADYPAGAFPEAKHALERG
jgi:hypothetical protein